MVNIQIGGHATVNNKNRAKFGEKLSEFFEKCADEGLIEKDYKVYTFLSKEELEKDTDWEEEQNG